MGAVLVVRSTFLGATTSSYIPQSLSGALQPPVNPQVANVNSELHNHGDACWVQVCMLDMTYVLYTGRVSAAAQA